MITKNKGFTLVELMITLAMTGIIIAAVYSVYSMQQRAYSKQNQILEIQQNLRAVLYTLGQQIRLAGFSFTPGNSKFTKAEATALEFSSDKRKKNLHGVYEYTTENVIYSFSGTTLKINNQPLADNIENIEFYYTLRDGSQELAPASKNDIRAVTISILGRAANPDNAFEDTNIYKSASGVNWSPTTARAKHYRRQLFITTIQCRNMGL